MAKYPLMTAIFLLESLMMALILIMEEKHFCTSKKVSRYRKRYDSEMNFDEYLDLYKKAPDPPTLKPSVDPIDELPPFELEEATLDDKDDQKEKPQKQKQEIYRLESIPEVEDSQNNSFILKSPSRNFAGNLKLKNDVRDETEMEVNPKHVARRRRAQSETFDYQILTFLSENCRSSKRVKKQ